ncbi:MAG: hypothetical protein EP332_12500 [Bacteroidetes bacterium]|nr:MAG: hypothetical protein EP332_12500 [Bacteroidota bacterium]
MHQHRIGFFLAIALYISSCTIELISGSDNSWNESMNRGWYYELVMNKEPVIVTLDSTQVPLQFTYSKYRYWLKLDFSLNAIYVSKSEWISLEKQLFSSPDSIFYRYKKYQTKQAFYPIHEADTQALKLELGKIQTRGEALFMTDAYRDAYTGQDSLRLYTKVLLRPNDLMLRDLVMLPKLD